MKLKNIEKYGAKNIAAEAQRLLEKNVIDLVFSWVQKTRIKNIVFSGGVFLNVKLNQRILQNRSDIIKNQHVYPNAGDSGLAVGAASYQYNIISSINLKA